MPILDHLEPRAVFSCFEQLCAIPHGSGNTKAISDYLVRFAAEHQLRCIQDAHNNVIIFAPGTPGYESAAPVILQGHMDMVCETAPDCTKDMAREGLDLFVDGDMIGARGTTLGGDDGIAVAMALAILAADDIPHPPLEVVITVDEETGMLGAAALDASVLKGRTMLNLDSEDEGVLTVSCAGGNVSVCTLPVTRAPFSVHLNSAMTGAFETLAPYITEEPLKTLVQDVAGNADAIAACCMGSPDLFPFVTTTIAPTMIHGGSAACNVMPQDMTAVINFRLADGDTVESVMAHCREAVQDKGVEMRFLQANDPSAIAKRDGYGYRRVVESMQRYFPDVVFIPSMTAGATDAHRYEEICDTCLRCSPFMTEPAEAASGVHGTNERLLVRSYLQGIRVLIDLMEHANVEP
jgi:acetylornithine deacetylase/succinyl-diaminopimelate desuccinylase-like protein